MTGVMPSWRAFEIQTVSQVAVQKVTADPRHAVGDSGGFTLLELMTILTVVGVLIGIAIPSYKYVTNSSRVSSEANQLLGDMQFARSEAVREGSFVTVCPTSTLTVSASGTVTAASCSGASNWATGWMVFSDLTGNGVFNSGADQVLRWSPKFTSTDTFVPQSGTLTNVIFNREGYATSDLSSAGSAGIALVLNTAPTNKQWQRCVLVTYVGLVKVVRSKNFGGPTTACP
jgi:type IV fimbrial biogenesis protein FimT